MISILANEFVDKIIRRVDMSKAILITGAAETSYAANRISYYDSALKAQDDYGDCDLVDAIKVAIAMGAPHVFAINVRKKHDYIDLLQVFRQYEFAYITPIDIKFSDFFYDSNRGNAKITYVRDYLERSAGFGHSVYMLTDTHASLYEDIDAFLDDMIPKTDIALQQTNIAQKGRNVAFVANNLRSYPYANVVLASAIVKTDLSEYPNIPFDSEAVFDLDHLDIGETPLIYFKNNTVVGTTVENLVNMDKKITPVKFIPTDRIIKYIQRTLDLSDFHGKPYTEYQRVRVEKALEEYLERLSGWILEDYKIISVVFHKELIGVGSIECKLEILPTTSSEVYSVVVE